MGPDIEPGNCLQSGAYAQLIADVASGVVVCVFTRVEAHVYACMWRPEIDTRYPLRYSTLSIAERSLSKSEFTYSCNLASSLVLRVLWICFPSDVVKSGPPSV